MQYGLGMTNGQETLTFQELKAGLGKIRQRRWMLWIVISSYLPIILFALQATQPGRAVAIAFGCWLFFLTSAVVLVTLARCPRCGNCFHMNGYLFRPVRKCFHCQLHLSAAAKSSCSSHRSD
ncbi:MAG: hypothetical protein C0619_07695 [Desulfuromonas sp.]|nr:MAG: hypothetical protein C0619_07695 [Desulfuromonas sp.]